MAYAFDRTLAALGRGKQPEEDSADIFAPKDPAQAQPGTSPGRIMASNTSGDLGPAQRNSSAPGGAAPQPQGSSTAAKNELLNRNRGRVGAPIDAGKLASDIQGAQTSVQNEANAYVQGADDRYGNDGGALSEADVSGINKFANPVKGDESGFAGADPSFKPDQKAPVDWQSLYSGGQASQVDPLKLTTDTAFGDAGLLANDAGLRELFRRSGDAEYNAGEASFDATLLGKDTGFNQDRENVLRSERGLRKTENDIMQNSAGQAQEVAQDGYENWRGNVDDQLLGAIDGYRQQAKDGESKFDSNLDRTNTKAVEKYFAEENAKLAAKGQLSDTISMEDFAPDELAKYMSGAVNADDTNWQDFVGADQANNWSSILQLMGRGSPEGSVPGQYAGKKTKDVSKFDPSKMYKEKSAQLKAVRDAKDKKASDEMAAARAAAEAAQAKKSGGSSGKKGKAPSQPIIDLGAVGKVAKEAEKFNPFKARG